MGATTNLYLEQKGIDPKPTLNQRTMLEMLIKDFTGVEMNLKDITMKQYKYLYAMVFKKNIESVKNFNK